MRRYIRDREGRFARIGGTGGGRARKAANITAHAGAAAANYRSGHRVTAALHGAKIATVTGRSAVGRVGPSYVSRGGAPKYQAKRALHVKSANDGLAKAEKYVDKALAASYGSIIGVKVAHKTVSGVSAAAAGRQAAKNGIFTGF
jgi:hypothetical protein